MPRPTSLTIELLRTFVLLIDHRGKANETAAELGVNQPSMSKRLSRLQFPGKALEHPWIVRDGKTWVPTEEGKRVLPAVRDLVDRYEQLQTFAARDEPVHAEVRFACGRQAATRFVHRAARQFWRDHPKVRLRVSTVHNVARVEGVANGSLDMAMVAHEESKIRAMARRELYVETVFKDRLALVCPRKARWARSLERLPKFKVGLAALKGFPLLLPSPEGGIRDDLNKALAESAMLNELEIRLEVSSWTAILAYAADGAGVGVVSESALTDSSQMIVRYFDPLVIPPVHEKIICRRATDLPERPDLSPDAYAFYRILKQAARQRWR